MRHARSVIIEGTIFSFFRRKIRRTISSKIERLFIICFLARGRELRTEGERLECFPLLVEINSRSMRREEGVARVKTRSATRGSNSMGEGFVAVNLKSEKKGNEMYRYEFVFACAW